MTIKGTGFSNTLDRFSAAASLQRAEVQPALTELQMVQGGGDIASPSRGLSARASKFLAPPSHGDHQRCCAPSDVRALTPSAKRDAVRRVLGVDLTAVAVSSPDVAVDEARMHVALGAYLGTQDRIVRRALGQEGR